MERYIIPFDFEGKSFYVFIDKDDNRKRYLVGRIMPYTDQPFPREISVETVLNAERLRHRPDSLAEAIVTALYKFLAARGWLALSN